MASLQERIVGVLRLDPSTFEEIEHDENATVQALMVVVASAIAAAIGAAAGGMRMLFLVLVAALIGWVVWAVVTFVVGTKLLPEPQTRADVGQMLRVLGFATAPGLFAILGFIPLLGWLVRFAVWIWQLAAMVVGVRQALDYSTTGRAVLVCVIGWALYMLVSIVFALMFGGMAAMSGAFAQ